jgi:hypothetical protein
MNENSTFTKSSISKFHLLLVAASGIILLCSCKATTVLLANFKNDNIGSPPGPNQPTGSVLLNPGSGLITVVASPPIANQPANKWALITHPAQPATETTLTGRFTQSGTGKYGLLASMHIPGNAGVVSVQFEAANPPGSFMHLDFMAEGDLRIDDDDNLRFGHFPRDKNFVLSVKFDITATTATVEFTLLGADASGNKIVNVKPLFLPVARQFGAVKFWIGFQHRAEFFVDDIVVTRKN